MRPMYGTFTLLMALSACLHASTETPQRTRLAKSMLELHARVFKKDLSESLAHYTRDFINDCNDKDIVLIQDLSDCVNQDIKNQNSCVPEREKATQEITTTCKNAYDTMMARFAESN